MLLDDKVTKAAAQAACQYLGATLAVPTNSYVADVIVSKKALTFFDVKLNSFTLQLRGVTENYVWTGVTTQDYQVWSSTYHDWYGDEPNNHGATGNYPSQGSSLILFLEKCTGMGDVAGEDISFAPGWFDVLCDAELQPLCQKSCEGCTLDHGKFDKAICIV